jgi:hypothetical protein
MIYFSTITNPANTSEGNAIATDMAITKGLIWLIEFEFPSGCAGLVHVQIFDGAYQMFPATYNQSLRGDGIVVKYDDLYMKLNPPYTLRIKTWNDDDTFQHTIQVRVGIASIEAFMARYLPSIVWDKFNEMLATIVAQQENIKENAVETLQDEIPQELIETQEDESEQSHENTENEEIEQENNEEEM